MSQNIGVHVLGEASSGGATSTAMSLSGGIKQVKAGAGRLYGVICSNAAGSNMWYVYDSATTTSLAQNGPQQISAIQLNDTLSNGQVFVGIAGGLPFTNGLVIDLTSGGNATIVYS